MATFTIDNEDNITVFASAAEAAQAGDRTAIQFDSQAALGKVSADWPLGRFVEIWNSISGNKQLSKFADRKKAVARIWAAIQPIAERAVASQSQEPKPAKSTRKWRTTGKSIMTSPRSSSATGKSWGRSWWASCTTASPRFCASPS